MQDVMLKDATAEDILLALYNDHTMIEKFLDAFAQLSEYLAKSKTNVPASLKFFVVVNKKGEGTSVNTSVMMNMAEDEIAATFHYLIKSEPRYGLILSLALMIR